MMIKINLNSKRKMGGGLGSVSGGGGTLSIGSFQLELGNLDAFKGLPLGKVLGFLVFYLVTGYAADSYRESQTGAIDAKIQEKTVEVNALEKSLGEQKTLEGQMNITQQDKKSMLTKINLVEELVRGRDSIPRMLQQFSKVIPQEIWISDFKVTEKNVTLRGFSLESNRIYDFKQALSGLPNLFTEIQVGAQTQQRIGDVDAVAFDLTGKRTEVR